MQAAAPDAAERVERARRLLHRAATAGIVLTFAVVVTSAYLRLAQAGLGCADWPACYGAPADKGASAPFMVALMRVIHRIAAAVVGFVVIVIVAVSFGRLRRELGQAKIAAVLAVLTVFLAVLGTATPGAQLPAVTLGNLFGGMLMLAAMQWLREDAATSVRAAARPIGIALLIGATLLALQVALGALVSANYAGASCPRLPGCGSAWAMSDATLALLDPWRLPSPLHGVALIDDPARAGLHMLHRCLAMIVLAWWCGIAVHAIAKKTRTATRPLRVSALLLVQCALGAAAVALSLPLWVAVLHNALAAVTVLALASCLYYTRSSDAASVSAACQIVISK